MPGSDENKEREVEARFAAILGRTRPWRNASQTREKILREIEAREGASPKQERRGGFRLGFPQLALAGSLALLLAVLYTVPMPTGEIPLPIDTIEPQAIPQGRLLQAGEHEHLITLPDKSTLRLSPNSLFVLTPRGGAQIELRHGELQANVTPQIPGQSFRVRTPHAEVEVIGTRFTITVGGRASRDCLITPQVP